MPDTTCGEISTELANLAAAIAGISGMIDSKLAPIITRLEALENAPPPNIDGVVRQSDLAGLVNPLIGVAVGGFATKEMVQGIGVNFATKGELSTVAGNVARVEGTATNAITKAEKAASTASNLSFEIRKVESVANNASDLARRISPEDVKKALSTAEAAGQRVNVVVEIVEEAKGTASNAASTAAAASSKADEAKRLVGTVANKADEAASAAAQAGNLAKGAASKADDAARGLGKLAGQVAGQLAKFAPLLALLGVVSTLLEVAQGAATLLVLGARLDEMDRAIDLTNKALGDLYTALSKMRSYIDTRDKELYDTFSKGFNDLLAEIYRLKGTTTNISSDISTLIDSKINAFGNALGLFGLAATVAALATKLANLQNKTDNMPQCRYNPALDQQALAQAQANNKLTTSLTAYNAANLTQIQSKLGAQLPGGLSAAASKIINSFNALTNLINSSFSKTWKFLKLDRVLNVLNFAFSLHNALMLSRSLGETLLDVTSSVLSAIGLKDANGLPFDLQEFFGSQIEQFIIGIVGQEAYEGNKEKWNKANRIISSAANLLWSMQSMIYNAIEGLEIIGGWIAKMANGLKFDGVVSDNLYGWFNPNPNFKNPVFKAMEKLNDLDDAASQIYMISTNVIDFQETAQQLGEQKAALQKAITDYNDLATTEAIQEDFNNQSPEISAADKAPAEEQE